MREELDQNDLELELSSSKRAHMQELYKRLHVCKALTGNPNFYASGNGLGISFENKLVLWFSNERIEGKPNKRVRKSSVPNYLQQDAIDGLIAFANIAERYAPYEWKAKEHSDTSERDKRELLKTAPESYSENAASSLIGSAYPTCDQMERGPAPERTKSTRIS